MNKPRAPWLGRLLAQIGRQPVRPMALALAGAAIGLVVASFGLFHAAVREQTTLPPGAVALVNQEPVLMSDFITETEQAEGVPFDKATPAQKAKMLRSMIDQELLVQRALALDLPEQDTGSRTALQDGLLALVVAPVLNERPTDATLKAYYAAHPSAYANQGTMTLTDLVIHVGGFENAAQTVDQAMADAQQAVYEIRSGANLDYVKQHYSLVDSGKVSGIEPDFAAKIHLGAKLYALADRMNDGTASDPVADVDGVHVLLMDVRKPPVFLDYEGVRNNVYDDYMSDLKAKAKQDNLKFLRRGAQIQIAPGHSE